MLKRKHKVGRSTRSKVERALATQLLLGETPLFYARAAGGDEGVVLQTSHRLLLVDLEPSPSIALAAPLERMAGVHLDVDDLRPVLHVELCSGARLQVPVSSSKALDRLVDHAWRAMEARVSQNAGPVSPSTTQNFSETSGPAPTSEGPLGFEGNDEDLLLAMRPDPLHIVISRRHVESGDVAEVLGQLEQLTATPERVKYFRERVWLSVEGYDHDPRELDEIPEVCAFLDTVDDKFPFWLYFLDKRTTSLLMMTRCLLSRRVRAEDGPDAVRAGLGSLLSTWWFPAVNIVADQAGLTETELEELSERATLYFQRGHRAFENV